MEFQDLKMDLYHDPQITLQKSNHIAANREDNTFCCIISADKPIYQPHDTAFFQILLYDPLKRVFHQSEYIKEYLQETQATFKAIQNTVNYKPYFRYWILKIRRFTKIPIICKLSSLILAVCLHTKLKEELLVEFTLDKLNLATIHFPSNEYPILSNSDLKIKIN
jgi:hypothetical protein